MLEWDRPYNNNFDGGNTKNVVRPQTKKYSSPVTYAFLPGFDFRSSGVYLSPWSTIFDIQEQRERTVSIDGWWEIDFMRIFAGSSISGSPQVTYDLYVDFADTGESVLHAEKVESFSSIIGAVGYPPGTSILFFVKSTSEKLASKARVRVDLPSGGSWGYNYSEGVLIKHA